MPKPEQLHDALTREDDDEGDIDIVEDAFELGRHVVVFQRHRDHVEHNDDHDEDIELLVRRYVEQNIAGEPLLRKPNNNQ